MNPGFAALLGAAALVGSLHSAAPDHWTPLGAAARVRGWSAGRTARISLLCGFGHVSVSAALGLAALLAGMEAVLALGHRMESVSGLLLLGFGFGWAVWGWRNAVEHAHAHLHGHTHAHAHRDDDASRVTVAGLFALYCADPCIAVIPLLFAAAPLGAFRALAVVLAYEGATISTMVVLALAARSGASLFPARWVERWGDVAAGGAVMGVGALAAAGVV
ncbi:MAG TPA: hypothetical protein VMV18_07110 [bacterium]|nr:hypothetical protein [bacterium]